MTESIILNCAIIFFARVLDVTLGTLRTLSIVRGNRVAAWLLGFFEILIWIWVVSQVIQTVRETPIYAIFYAIGFATGGSVGITIERWLAFGEKSILLFTRSGELVAEYLRAHSFVVTQWEGQGRDGSIVLIFMKTPRRQVSEILKQVQTIDPTIFYVVDSVDSYSSVRPFLPPRTGWRTMSRKAK